MADLRAALQAAASHTKKDRTQEERKALQDALRDVRSAISSLFPDHETRHSEGQTIPAGIPWVSIHPKGTSGADPKSGYYAVYLFAEDGSRVNLSLGVGTTAAGGKGAISARAAVLRSACAALSGTKPEPELASAGGRAAEYSAGSAYSFVYDAEDLPDEVELSANLGDVLERLDATHDSGLRFESTAEPLHIFYPWVEERGGPGIVAARRAIAEGRGAAWWVTNTSIGAPRLEDFKAQLASGITTFVYLYAAGDSWRAKLAGITTDAEEVLGEPDLLAAGAQPISGRLSMKLSEFEALPTDWRGEGLFSAANGTPVEQSVAGRPAFTYVHSGRLEDHGSAANGNKADGGGVTPTKPSSGEREAESLLALAALSGIELGVLRAMHEVLQSDLPQLVLAGPPGTGKTWLARHLARIGNQRNTPYSVVQFHPSYAYEDFIEGLRPTSRNNQIVFENEPGHLLQVVRELPNGGPDTLIIDELNRANIPSVFGELLYLLEYRGDTIRLRLSGEFRLPRELRFIATMNTADRSVRSMDAALRRRFEIFELPPSGTALQNYYATSGVNEVPDLVLGFNELNARLTAAIDRHHGIGHSFFMRTHLTPSTLSAIWERKVRPLLEEYFFDEPHRVDNEFSLLELWPSLTS